MGRKEPGRGGLLVLVVLVTVCVAWLSWAWSPAVEDMPTASEDAEPAAVAPSVEAAQAEAVAQPAAPSAAQVERPAPASDASVLERPERIPTPHPMSLDQARPPEQYGSLFELKQQYESESRAAESSETEAGLRAMITTPNIPPDLVQDITCRRKLCKLEAHWTPRRRLGFAVVLESFKQMYFQRVAVEPAAGPSADGSYVTTLYVRLTRE